MENTTSYLKFKKIEHSAILFDWMSLEAISKGSCGVARYRYQHRWPIVRTLENTIKGTSTELQKRRSTT